MPTIKIDDVEVELEECGHCKILPSELDAQKSLQKARLACKEHPCPACGLEIKIKGISIAHRDREWGSEGAIWKLVSVDLGDAVRMEIYGYQRSWIHRSCFERIFGGRIEASKEWRPWSDGSLFVQSTQGVDDDRSSQLA